MKALGLLWQELLRQEPPYYMKKHSIFFLIWKVVRKYINVSIAPFVPFNVLRIWLYKLIGYQIGKDVFIGMMCYLDDTHPELFTVEDNVTVSYRGTFAVHGIHRDGWKNEPIALKEGCYIGVAATVLSGVTVGKNAIVGAGAVVTKDVMPGAVVVGVPARPLNEKDA